MKKTVLQCSLLTPTWLAGADQGNADIRVPSIRGELRWWFRVLGGTAEQEKAVFGGVYGGRGAAASCVRLRVCQQTITTMTRSELPSMRMNTPLAWLWYFSKAGENEALRFSEDGCVAPGSSFALEVRYRQAMAPDTERLWCDTLRAFACLGSLGFRANRAAGALDARSDDIEIPDTPEAIQEWAASHASVLNLYAVTDDASGEVAYCEGWQAACKICESLTRALRKKFPAGKNGDQPTPLGSATPRQGSAAAIRPIAISGQLVPALVCTPGVLANESQDSSFLSSLSEFRFAHPYEKDKPLSHQLKTWQTITWR